MNKKNVDKLIQVGKYYSKFTIIQLSSSQHISLLHNLLMNFTEQIEQLADKIRDEIEQELDKGNITEDDVGYNSIYISAVPIIKEWD